MRLSWSCLVAIISVVIRSYSACQHGCYCTDTKMKCNNLNFSTFKALRLPSGVTTLQVTASLIQKLNADLLASVTNLVELEISNSRIRNIADGAFIAFGRLQKLNLNSNLLTRLRGNMFSGLANLKYLELQRNNITDLSAGVFEHLESVVEMKLMRNSITSVPNGVFTPLSTLRLLFLSNNLIDELGDKAFQKLSFNWFSLANNEIRTFPTSAFDGFRVSTAIMLLGNPFDCSCNYSIDYAVNLNHLKGKITAYCKTPYNAERKHIMEAHNELFCTQCDLNLCQNQATCAGDKHGYTCECRERFKGKHCETNICSSHVPSTPLTHDYFKTINPGSKTISINDVKYVPLTEVKKSTCNTVDTSQTEKVLYAMCALEFCIIIGFVVFLAYKRYVEWKEEKRFNTEVGRDILERVRFEGKQKLLEALARDPAPIHIKQMILHGSSPL